MITSSDVKVQVITSLTGSESEFDVKAIVNDIIQAHGLVDIDTIDDGEYWAIVERHAI